VPAAAPALMTAPEVLTRTLAALAELAALTELAPEGRLARNHSDLAAAGPAAAPAGTALSV